MASEKSGHVQILFKNDIYMLKSQCPTFLLMGYADQGIQMTTHFQVVKLHACQAAVNMYMMGKHLTKVLKT